MHIRPSMRKLRAFLTPARKYLSYAYEIVPPDERRKNAKK
jgi:hypothetical protein